MQPHIKKSFKKLSELEEKTAQELPFYVCLHCGGLTISRQKHLKWHQKIIKKIDNASGVQSPYWPGVDPE